ncbi:trypsin-like [Amblyraja radiata]|uniref:trypsin-like n=1 Tax=Amblyraja radiata TaxID=386614 RepID=UPI001403C65F|nr:trypsin-like [Amblyraja radiata]
MKTLLLLVFLGLASATGDVSIVGGYECRKHAVPWIVPLNVGYHLCGRSLITPRWVVSATHCYRSGRDIHVRLGEHDITATEGSEQFINSEMVTGHPKYDYYTQDNDIMLIKLSRPAAMDSNVVALPLPVHCAQTGDMCLISGWGNTLDTAASGHQLQCLDAPVLSDADCYYPGMITDNMTTGPEGGDSGGPVVCDGVLQGVVSWGYGCADRDHPGVYTRVCHYVSWINNTIAAN